MIDTKSGPSEPSEAYSYGETGDSGTRFNDVRCDDHK